MPALSLAHITPRDYQHLFVGDALKRIDDANPGDAFLYASPTGSGKSLMELLLLGYCPEWMLITPRLEIVAGMLAKGGIDCDGWSDDRLAAEALTYRITTPVRLRNMLAKGTLPFRPTGLIIDECHHTLADTYQDIDAYLPGCVKVGLTATPFRGTAAGTKAMRESYVDLTWVLTYPQAAERGVIAVPSCDVWPLIDDDELEVINGEIRVASAGVAVGGVLDEVVQRCEAFRRTMPGSDVPASIFNRPAWDRPTLCAVPTTETCRDLAARLDDAGLPAAAVTQDTPRAERNRIFAAAERAEIAIVQIDVVSEGVDLQLRRLIDLRPTMSPVRWLQQVGRITRPVATADLRPEYICCTRNLERHCYLYDGLLPPTRIAEAQQAFGGPSKRAGMRAVGVENLGRFKSAELPLAGGVIGTMYQITAVAGFTRSDYAILLHPCSPDAIYATRDRVDDGDGNVKYGKWQQTDSLPDLKGFSSAPAAKISDKQLAWHVRSAKYFGLDETAVPNKRNFAALPVLSDLGVKLK